MFFTRLANILAWGALILGAFRMALGFIVGSIDDAANRAAWAARYLGNGTIGEAIDEGLIVLVFGIVLGAILEGFKRVVSLKTGA